MEIQVQELIDKIKKDGIETAAGEAAKIKQEADAEARRIIEAAKKEANEIIVQGKQDAERSQKAGVAALQQASRNLVLAFKDEIQGLLDKLIQEKVTANYDENLIKSVMPDILKNWAAKSDNDLSVILPESELSKIQKFFNEQLSKELSKGIELKSSRALTSGFRISNKEGSVYYEFSAETVAQLLAAYLNPKLAEILKTSVKGN